MGRNRRRNRGRNHRTAEHGRRRSDETIRADVLLLAEQGTLDIRIGILLSLPIKRVREIIEAHAEGAPAPEVYRRRRHIPDGGASKDVTHSKPRSPDGLHPIPEAKGPDPAPRRPFWFEVIDSKG